MSAPLPRYVVFGEALTDLIREADGRWTERPGGSCWNVARVGARLGIATGCATAVSNDYFGAGLVAESRAAGLDARYLQVLDRSPLLAMVTSTRPPAYQFVGDDSADLHFAPERLPAGWLAAAEVVHVGGISLARRPLADRLLVTALDAVAAGKRLAFDPNWRTPMADPAWRAVYDTLLPACHYLKLSDEDLAQLYPQFDEHAALATVRAALRPDAALMYTRGARGLMLFSGAAVIDEPARATTVIDTVGCGDAAMGAWMATLLADPAASLDRQAQRAAAAAGVVAGRTGAYAPLPAEVDALAGRGHGV